MKYFLSLFAIVFLFSCSTQKDAADTIYFNADIWTGDSANPHATSIAVKGGMIVYVGSDYANYKGDATEMIDVHGKMITPGFIDDHTHFLNGGHDLAGIDLHAATSKEQFIQTIKAFAASHNDSNWITGGNWDHEFWGGELPRKEWIDSVCGNHPLFVNRYDGHSAFANSKALQLAGITAKTAAPAGGEIVQQNNEPTGVLKDEAMDLVFRIIPQPAQKEFDEYFSTGQQHALENGVTQVVDMSSFGGWNDLGTYRKAYEEKKLQMRIYSFVPLGTWQRLDSFCKANDKGDDMLRWGGLKGFVDGSLGSTTAWFYQPYLDAPNTGGLQITDTNLLRQWTIAADSAGLQVAVHAIGDHANDFILDVFEEAEKKNPNKDHRFRVEHAQHLAQHTIPRFAILHVTASMQPYHAIDDGRWAYKRLDDARLRGTYVFNSLLQTGANVVFGSDWPVAPLKPIQGIYAAVTRRTLDDKNPGGWYPAEKISVAQALTCYTANNAYAIFMENKTGKLKAGMFADFVVLSENLFNIAPEKIKDVMVLRTVVNGKSVYEKK